MITEWHRRTGIFLPGGGGNPFAQKILASCPNFYRTVERKLGPCGKIGRTGIWKWLDKVFQSQYLPSLSINFVATNKHLEKIATTVVLDKKGNLSWSGLQRHWSCHSNEMTPLPYSTCSNISHWELFLQNRSGELFPPTVASMFVKLKRNCKSVIEIFWDEVFIVKNTVKKENLDG